jgi:hypothetical protein
VNLRTAKKVLFNPNAYTGQQRYAAAHRLYRRASTFKDGLLGFWALKLKPQRSFHADDQLDLRYEYFLSRYDKLEEIDFPDGDIVIPKEELRKPVFRRDGQVQNFNALPFPSKASKISFKPEVVKHSSGDATLVNHVVVEELEQKTWEMGEWRVERPYSKKKYHVREAKVAGKRPPRLKRKDFGLPTNPLFEP